MQNSLAIFRKIYQTTWLLGFSFIIYTFPLCSSTPIHHKYDMSTGMLSDNVFQVVEDSKGAIWIGHDNGISQFNGSEFKHYKSSDLVDSYITLLAVDNADQIYFRNYFNQFGTIKNDSIILFEFKKTSEKIVDFHILESTFYYNTMDVNNQLSFYKTDCNHLFDPNYTTRFLQLEVPNRDVYNFVTNKENLFFRSGYDLIQFNYEQGIIVDTIEHNSSIPEFQLNLAINEDKVSFYIGNKVYLYDTSGKLIQEYLTNEIGNYSIYFERNQILLGLKGSGLLLLDANTAKRLFDNYFVNYIFKDSKHRIWIGTREHGLIMIPDLSAIETPTIDKSHKVSAFGEYQITEYPRIIEIRNKIGAVKQIGYSSFKSVKLINDTLRLACYHGYYEIAIANIFNSNEVFYPLRNETSIINNKSFDTEIYKDKIILSHIGGIELIHGKKSKLLNIPNAVKAKSLKISEDNLYIIDMAGNLHSYDLINNSFKTLSSISHFKGFYSQEQTIYIFDVNDVYILNEDSQLLDLHPVSSFVGLNNLLHFSIKAEQYQLSFKDKVRSIPFESIKKIPTPNINFLALNNIPIAKAPLSIKQQNVCFTLQSENFAAKIVPIYYAISKRGKSFNPHQYLIADQNEICLNNLSKGEYKIKVGFGKNLDYYKEQNFNIILPITKNPIFIAACLLFGLGIILFWYWYSAKTKLRLKSERLQFIQDIDKLKIQLLQNQLNPHYLFNLLSSVKLRIVKDQTDEAISLFQLLINHLSQYFSYIGHDITNLDKELEFVESYVELESFRRQKEILFKQNVIDIKREELIDINLPTMLIQPLVENAIKHNPALSRLDVLLTIKKEGSYLRIIVENNLVNPQPIEKMKKSSIQLIEKSLSIYNQLATKVIMEKSNNGLTPVYRSSFKLKLYEYNHH